MRPLAWSVAACLPLALAASTALPEIRWRPDPPRQGSLVLLVVRPESAGAPVTGTLGGEPLHFEPAGDGWLAALGGVPLSARDSIAVRVTTGDVTTAVRMPVAHRAVRREALRTNPRFTRRPDSALAARIAREYRLVTAALRRSHRTPRLWREPFATPRPGGGAVVSDFGLEREFNGVVESRHTGVDLAGARGDSVLAANRGVVTLVANLFFAGRTVFVDHGAGLLTGYLHLDRALVARGDTVRRHQLIGLVGASGRVTGPHLHWLARYGGIAVDPHDLVTLDLTPLLPPPPPPPPP